MLFDAQWQGPRVPGGVPEHGIYDNMWTAGDRIGRGKERRVDMRVLVMANHCVCNPEVCTPATGPKKGQVGKSL